MKLFDLTVFKFGLENEIFNSSTLMDLLYGPLCCYRNQDNTVCLQWHLNSFNLFSVSMREQLVKLMLRYDTQKALRVGSITDIANNRAICALRTTIYYKESDICDCAVFNACTAPAVAIQEIILWEKWGIKFTDEVYQLAQTVIKVFLEDTSKDGSVYTKIITKKEALLKREKELNSRLAILLNRSRTLEAKICTLKSSPQCSFSELHEYQNKFEKTQYDILQSTEKLALVYQQLGQAETWPLAQSYFAN